MNANPSTTASLLLSVIIPAYNAERFIEGCLGSVFGQMEAWHELILVDDGSQDRTGELAERVRSAHPNAAFTLIRQPNGGVSQARNAGLAAAAGEYVLFVDADDLLLPESLAALDAVAREHSPDVIACDFNTWHPDKPGKSHRVSLGYQAERLTSDRDEMLLNFFADRHTYLWANVFRREVYARQPAPLFPPGRVYEDLSVLPRLVAECATLYRLARPVIDYRQHPSSITKSISSKWCRDYVSALAQVKRYFSQQPASDAVHMLIDVTACHFYIGIVKNSFQLSWREGRSARQEVRALFLDSLFHHPLAVLAAMERGTILTRDHKLDTAVAKQVRKALDNNLAFSIAKAASRKIKLWQRTAAA